MSRHELIQKSRLCTECPEGREEGGECRAEVRVTMPTGLCYLLVGLQSGHDERELYITYLVMFGWEGRSLSHQQSHDQHYW